jgi:hypothetical protein
MKHGESSVKKQLIVVQAGIVAEYVGPPTAVVAVVVVIPVTVQRGFSLNLAVFNASAPPTTANTAIAVKRIFAFFMILFVRLQTATLYAKYAYSFLMVFGFPILRFHFAIHLLK